MRSTSVLFVVMYLRKFVTVCARQPVARALKSFPGSQNPPRSYPWGVASGGYARCKHVHMRQQAYSRACPGLRPPPNHAPILFDSLWHVYTTAAFTLPRAPNTCATLQYRGATFQYRGKCSQQPSSFRPRRGSGWQVTSTLQ